MADQSFFIAANPIDHFVESLKRIEKLTERPVGFYNVNLCDYEALKQCLNGYLRSDGTSEIEAVVHFAGLKAVGESWEMPLLYYQNNITGTLNLLRAMDECGGIKKIIFSSSATVYGELPYQLLTEDLPVAPISPYGRTKAFIESIISDTVKANPQMCAVILRYFNPVGADASGMIGEDLSGIPNNLMPFVAQVAIGKIGKLRVFGNDYESEDGTCVRDYIHVTDLAKGHIAALKKLDDPSTTGTAMTVNLGTGKGTSVLDIVNVFMKTANIEIPYDIVGRRPGDAPFLVADPSRAKAELNWTAELGLEQMCRDLWNWQSKNPNGYASK